MSARHPSPDGTWISDEPRLLAVAGWVVSRAMHHWRLVALAALLVTALAVAHRAAKKPTYEATLYFRFSEGELREADHGLRPPADIRQHIMNVALSRKEIEPIMRKYGHSVAWLERDRVAAIDEFRSSIELTIERNYFIYERSSTEEPRSAYVTITLAGAEEEQTRAIVHDIGALILRDQAQQRGVRLEQARATFRAQLAQVRGRARSLQDAIARLTGEIAAADGREAIPLRARLTVLQGEARSAIEHEIAIARRASAVAFSAAASDEEQLGTRFELVDERLAVFAPPLREYELALRGVATFAIVLLVAAILFGAFDDRVYGPRDVTARGLPLFGALPWFPGGDAGSYRARMAQPRA